MGKRKVFRASALATILAMSGVFSAATFAKASNITTANVTVNAASSLTTIPSTAFGVNTAVWDGHLMDPSVPDLLKNIGTNVLRYPGGSTSDVYHWQTNTVDGGWAFPQDNFDNFMKVAQAANAQPIITANYGTGTPEEAAAWVKYANVTHNYNVKYWEIGNEIYGDGSYGGSGWEANNRQGKGPQQYADNALNYIQAMKAVDPSIKVGVVLTAPNNWPWGQSPDWNKAVLQTTGSKIDFVIVHWYPQGPGSESDAALLSSTDQISSMMGELKKEVDQYAGDNAKNIQIMLTETNSVSSNPGKQTTGLVNALYLDDDLMDWLQAGAATVDWWDLHNGATGGNISNKLYGNMMYGDYGLLANGSTLNGSGLPAETPYPAYYGYEMLTHLGKPGDSIVAAGSDQSMLSVHAVKQSNGDVAVMMVNKDPNQPYQVNLNVEGFQSTGDISEYTYGEGSSAIQSSSITNPDQPMIAAPYSVTTLVLKPASSSSASPTVQMSQSTTLSSDSITPSQAETISTTLTNTDPTNALTNGVLDLEVYNSGGQLVGQKLFPGVNLQPGQSDTVSYAWTAPNAPDNYTVKAFVFNSDMSQALLGPVSVGTFAVAVPPDPTLSTQTTVTPDSVKAGDTVNVQTQFTDSSTLGYLNNGILDMEVYDAKGNKVQQKFFNESLSPGQSVTESMSFTAPSTPGTYTIKLGVFSNGWGKNFYWNDNAGTITVN